VRLKRGRARQDWPHAPYRYGLTPPDRWGLFIPIPTFRIIKETIMPSNITRKLIQLLGKSIYDNRRKIRKKMLSSLSFLTYRD